MKMAVIPARGGSKRIARKNIRQFAGKPMLCWSIEVTRASGLFDAVIVSTDDDEIAECARANGAQVPFMRPAELADDYAGTTEVLAHAARWAIDAGHQVAAVCCIYATAPFLKAEDLSLAAALFDAGGWDYVFSAARFSYPVQRAFERAADGGIAPLFPAHRLTRSQDLPAIYHDAGQFYWGSAEAWVALRPIFGKRSTFVELPPWRVQDIDTPEDWKMAEMMLEVTRGMSNEW